MLPYQTESASRSLPVRRTPPAGHEARRFSPSSSTYARHVRPAVRPASGSRRGPADRLDRITSAALGLHDAAEDDDPSPPTAGSDCSSAVAAKSR